MPSVPGCPKSANKVTESTDDLMWEGSSEFGMGPNECERTTGASFRVFNLLWSRATENIDPIMLPNGETAMHTAATPRIPIRIPSRTSNLPVCAGFFISLANVEAWHPLPGGRLRLRLRFLTTLRLRL